MKVILQIITDYLRICFLSFLHPVNTTNFSSMMYSLHTDYNTEGGILIVTRHTVYNNMTRKQIHRLTTIISTSTFSERFYCPCCFLGKQTRRSTHWTRQGRELMKDITGEYLLHLVETWYCLCIEFSVEGSRGRQERIQVVSRTSLSN